MKSSGSILLFFVFLFILLSEHLFPCTTAIVSGKATADHRPLLWKHRDSDFEQNKIMSFNDGQYRYVGLVNSADSLGAEVWAGCNSAGFAIMNSASYNLKPESDTTEIKDREGLIMKKALQSCATLPDFEELLKNLPKPLGVEANFGVIDAQGGAAYYEVDNFNVSKLDVNDPKIAPFGYLIHTNFSFTGNKDEGYGYIRYQAADKLFYQAAARNALSAEFILREGSRCLKHGLTSLDLTENLPDDSFEPDFVAFQDFIARNSSTSTALVQGVKTGESAEFTTLWTILGFQLCSVAAPCWPAGGSELPKILQADENKVAPLCDKALRLKALCFPVTRDNGDRYLNRAVLLNRQGAGIMQKLQPLEAKIFSETAKKMALWRKDGMEAREIQKYYRWLDEGVQQAYLEMFGI